MLGALGYRTKKELKESVGKPLRFIETSAFGNEFKEDGKVTMVGPDADNDRKWFAEIEMEKGLIKKVS